jgi:DNA polymerase III sliding clamp (beta) subunit (PCNA family)
LFGADQKLLKITLVIDNKEVAKGIETHRAKIDGDNSNTLEILFNIKYLTRVIKTIPFDTIYLKLGSPTSPVIIEPASTSSLRTEHLLALAPIGL